MDPSLRITEVGSQGGACVFCVFYNQIRSGGLFSAPHLAVVGSPDLTAFESEPYTLLDIEMKDGTSMRAVLTRTRNKFDLSADVTVMNTGRGHKVMLHEVRNARVVAKEQSAAPAKGDAS